MLPFQMHQIGWRSQINIQAGLLEWLDDCSLIAEAATLLILKCEHVPIQ